MFLSVISEDEQNSSNCLRGKSQHLLSGLSTKFVVTSCHTVTERIIFHCGVCVHKLLSHKRGLRRKK